MLGRVEGEWNFAWISKHVAKAAKQVSPICEKVYNTSNTYDYVIIEILL